MRALKRSRVCALGSARVIGPRMLPLGLDAPLHRHLARRLRDRARRQDPFEEVRGALDPAAAPPLPPTGRAPAQPRFPRRPSSPSPTRPKRRGRRPKCGKMIPPAAPPGSRCWRRRRLPRPAGGTARRSIRPHPAGAPTGRYRRPALWRLPAALAEGAQVIAHRLTARLACTGSSREEGRPAQVPLAGVAGAGTSPYGGRVHPFTGSFRFHGGTDILAGLAQPRWASADGRVITPVEWGLRQAGRLQHDRHPPPATPPEAVLVRGARCAAATSSARRRHRPGHRRPPPLRAAQGRRARGPRGAAPGAPTKLPSLALK